MKIFETLKNLFGAKSVSPVDSDPSAMEDLRRACWVPVTEAGDGTSTVSKFSGIPYLRPDEDWPSCPNCKKPMQLFVQLNSDELPPNAEKWGDGLLQLFYCTNFDPHCEVDCAGWEPFAKTMLVRAITTGTQDSTYQSSPVENAFPAKRITGWKISDDLPSWEETRELGVDVTDEVLEELSDKYPVAGEKLLGWPSWIQGVEYPNCPQCGTQMRYLFQIDSSHNLPFDFGDMGTGHITQCANHPDTFAFGWACS